MQQTIRILCWASGLLALAPAVTLAQTEVVGSGVNKFYYNASEGIYAFRHIAVNAAPSGAAARAATSASGWRHTSVPTAAIVITVQQPIASHAAGT